MSQMIHDLLQKCVVRIVVVGVADFGTGFFVAPGQVLTCWHVIQEHTAESLQIVWREQTFSVQMVIKDEEADLALIRLSAFAHPCVFLQEEVTLFDPLYTYGHTDIYPDGESGTFICEGWSGQQKDGIKFKTGQVRPGWSGSPLLNVRTGYVCGVIQTTRDRFSDLGGRAIAAQVIFRMFPDLRSQQHSLHDQDRSWLNCLDTYLSQTAYLESLYHRYASVTLPLGPVEGLSLTVIFQPLKLRRDPLAAEDILPEKRYSLPGKTIWEDNESERNQPLLLSPLPVIVGNSQEALEKSPSGRMVILGGPGTGKTTTLRYLVGDSARKALSDLTAPLPLLISLADFAHSGRSFQQYLLDFVNELGISESFAGTLWSMIEQGRAFICLDGLDEVDPQQRGKILTWINTMAARKGNTWIVGSRFTEYKAGQFKRGQFAEWELQPLSHELARALVERLLNELFMASKQSAEVGSATTLLSALARHSQTAMWSENPLLISLATIVFARLNTLPASRTLLYHEVISAILETHEHDAMQLELVRNVLSEVALEMYQHRLRTFNVSELGLVLPKVRTWQNENWETAMMAKRVIASGVLEVVARQTYAFRHQTFQEYLAATALARRFVSQDQAIREGVWQLVLKKYTYTRWIEILRLLVGVLVHEQGEAGKREAIKWLKFLLEDGVLVGGDPGAVGLALALKSLSEVAKTPDWQEGITLTIEREMVVIWVSELLQATRQERTNKRARLQSLARDVGYLQSETISIAITQLQRGLEDHNRFVQRVAAETLGELGEGAPDSVRDLLVSTLGHHAWDVRTAAAISLGLLKEHAPIEPLVKALQDESEYVRAAAADSLGKLGERAPIEPLVMALQDTDVAVRSMSAQALKALGERVPMAALLIALLDEDEVIRSIGVEALKMRGEQAPINALLRGVYHPADRVRSAATLALQALGAYVPVEAVEVGLSHTESMVRAAIISICSGLGERAPIEPLIQALHDPEWHVRKAAAEALESLKDYVPLHHYVDALHHTDGNVRSAIARALGSLGNQAPIDVLVQCLHDPDDFVRRAAAEAFAALGEKTPLEPLLAALHDPAWGIRMFVVQALAALGKRTPVQPLIDAYYDESTYIDANENVKAAIIRAMGVQEEKAPISLLVEAFHNEHAYVRAAAVSTFGLLGETISLEPLMDSFHDRNVEIRLASLSVLSAQDETTPVEPLITAFRMQERSIRIAGLQAMSKLGKNIPITILQEALADPDEEIRYATIGVLGNLANIVPVELLLMMLRDSSERVRRVAAETLTIPGIHIPLHLFFEAFELDDLFIREMLLHAVGSLDAVPRDFLYTILQDGSNTRIRVAAIHAFILLKEPVSLATLIKLLYGHDPESCVATRSNMQASGEEQ